MRNQANSLDEEGGRRASVRKGKRFRRDPNENDTPHTLAQQLFQALADHPRDPDSGLEVIPEAVPMSTQQQPQQSTAQMFQIPPQGTGEAQAQDAQARKAKAATYVIDAPYGTATLEAPGSTTVVPLREAERDAIMSAVHQSVQAGLQRDKYVKVAAGASTVLSFAALALLIFGGIAAVRNSAKGDE